MGWDDEHYAYDRADGVRNSFWKTVLESPQWNRWQKEQARRLSLMVKDKLPKTETVYDMPEVEECGWISQKHFQDFLKFIRSK
jgi:hypothetical protein